VAKGDNVYRLTLASPPVLGTEYTITANNIVDLIGSPIDPTHNQATFVKSSSFVPVVNSFFVVDSESGDTNFTNSKDVRIFVEERGIEGNVVKWLITESSTQPQLLDFILSGRPTTYTIEGIEGAITLYAWVMDEHNNVSTLTSDSQYTIILDMTNPAITSFDAINDRSLKITFSEPVRGANLPDNYNIEPGLGAISITSISSRVYELTFEEPQVLNQLYTLSIANISDLAGNPLLQEEIIFTGQAPSIPTVGSFMATDLDSGSSAYTNFSTVSITMTESDTGGDIAKWLVTESPAQPTPSDFVLTQRPATYTIQSGEGEVTLYAWVMDEANNISIATPNSQHTIVLDTTPPEIIITYPQDGAIVHAYKITLEGTIDGVAFQETRTLTEGQNTISKEYTDVAGNSSSVSITVTLDIPQVIITHDDLNRIKSITQYGKTTTYTYDEVGNITNINVEDEL